MELDQVLVFHRLQGRSHDESLNNHILENFTTNLAPYLLQPSCFLVQIPQNRLLTRSNENWLLLEFNI